jgi:hypothetical protein
MNDAEFGEPDFAVSPAIITSSRSEKLRDDLVSSNQSRKRI